MAIPALAMILSASLLTGAKAFGDEEKIQQTELPKLSELQLPSADELLKADDEDKEFDWIVLVNQAEADRRVIVVNPVFPRPDTLVKLAEEYKQVDNSKPQNAAEREKRIIRLKELQRVLVTLPGNFVNEYALPVNQIDHILLFEDLMLKRVDELLKSGDIRKAYEILLRVENELPNWQSAVPRFEQLLLVESTQRAQAGDLYGSLALLGEVALRNIDSPELRPRVEQIVSPLIDEALAKDDFRKARYLMARVKSIIPDHELVSRSNDRLQQLAAEVMQQANQKSQQKQFAEAAELAWKSESIAPSVGNARVVFSQCVARHQVLRVAVEDYDGQKLVFPSARESLDRLNELIEVPLFEPSSADELTYFRSSYFEIWDPTDLGREVVFSLRETRPYWQSQPLLTANDIADALGQRIDPGQPLFSPRLASFVREISVRSPSELRIRFSRVPLSIESLLRFPATRRPAPASGGREPSEESSPDVKRNENDPATTDTVSPVVLSTRFTQVSSDQSGRRYVRRQPEPDGLDPSQYHLAEIRERHFTDRDTLLQAVIRGEIDFLPHLLPWEVDAFKASDDFDTKQYAIPMTHVIAFNPMSERITSAQMRRGLSFAVNREAILRSVVLRDESMRYGRPTSAAWHLGSYATNPVEQAPEFNLRLAFALRFSAERQLQLAELKRLLAAAKADVKKNGGAAVETEQFMKETKVDYIKLPPLRFVVEPDPTAFAAAERMMIYWQKIGFEVDLIRGDQSGESLTDTDWDMCYRQIRMEEPLLELWPLLSNDTSLDMNRLGLFPDWMRQELIGLDYAGSFLDARDRLHLIHSRMAAQAFVIPLWEVDDFAVWRKSVLRTPDSPMSVYHNVERWIVRP